MEFNGKQLACPRCKSSMKLRSSFNDRARAKCDNIECGYHPYADKCLEDTYLSPKKVDNIAYAIPRADIEIYPIVTHKGEAPDGCTHYFIPDLQCKSEVDLFYCSWIGHDIALKRPDVIVNIGDHADMPSLSYYDKGTKRAEGKRVYLDIESSLEGMNRLLKPIWDIQQQELSEFGEIRYKPRMILTMGNHEERIVRHVEACPELFGFLSLESLRYDEFGWEVYPFLEPAMANGVAYCHYFANPLSGRPWGGTIMNVMKNVGESFTMGHVQKFDMYMRYLPASGRRQIGMVCGAAYPHDEHYKGPQGNHHFRGTVTKTNVEQGGYDFQITSLDTLKQNYELMLNNNSITVDF